MRPAGARGTGGRGRGVAGEGAAGREAVLVAATQGRVVVGLVQDVRGRLGPPDVGKVLARPLTVTLSAGLRLRPPWSRRLS